MTRAVRTMDEPDDAGPSPLWRWLRIFALGVVTVFLVGIVAGFLMGHIERGGGFGLKPVLIVGGFSLAALACLWLLVRQARTPRGQDPLTPKERLNRNVLVASGALGVVLAFVMAIAGRGSLRDGGVFTDAPLQPAAALALVLATGVLLPALSIFWHRSVIDEQEADAYKTGALYGLYTYMIGAPVWWLCWRGGFAPPLNGHVIYFVTITTVAVVFLWKKFR